MAGVASGGSGDARPRDGISSELEGGLTCEGLTEWRSSEQLQNGTPSTSPPFWDTDHDDDDCGLRPSELYGKHTWNIDKFSKINKRELRSNAFEVGGYKWYILIYPQGCDVCNHLSLFLCVANHDKLLPGWSHFAQFTISVVNKDPKKSKYSDTLHRFWKKEHDWGWKKFMELSKVMTDGFIDDDTLIIKAQVQVIREKADRPFRCLDRQYRRELVRVYLTNVEQICRRFLEERRSKLVKLMEDKSRWSSFCAFWLAIDPKSRHSMSRERTDTILRAIVKHFFIEKEVTSTLVMDSLYSGLRALEGQIKTKEGLCNLHGTEESLFPVVFVDQDMFVLIDDVLLLLERASLEPLPPKEDKGPQNRMKDGGPGDDFNKDSIECDERRLTEHGRRTIEIFVLAHIFSKIEGLYQEDVALKRQEELIREEAAWLETEQKSKRGAADKEKKSKKKQGKQKRNNRKGKEKGRDDNTIATLDKVLSESPDESKSPIADDSKSELENPGAFEDISDVSDTVNPVSEVLHPDSEERESSPLIWDTDPLEVPRLSEASGGGASPPSTVQNGTMNNNNSSCIVVDDSSSTCSTDSVPSAVTNGYHKANNSPQNQESRRSPIREVVPQNDSYGSRKSKSELKAAAESFSDNIKKMEPQVAKGKFTSHPAEPSIKDQAYAHKPPEKTTVAPSSPISSSKISTIQLKIEPKTTPPTAKISIKKPLSEGPQPAPSITNSADMAAFSRSSTQKSPTKLTEKSLKQEVHAMSRPLSPPIVPGPRPTHPVVSMVQGQPFLSRSVTHRHQSYRNAMMGNNNNILTSASTSSGYTQTQSPNIGLNPLPPYSAPPNSKYPPMFPLQSSEFGMVNPPFMQNDPHAPDLHKQGHIRSHGSLPVESPACTSGQPFHNSVTDEFPHLGIINDLLDDESGTSISFQSFNSGPQYLNRQFSYPGDNGMTDDMLVGPSSSSRRFGRARSYQENRFQSTYDSSMSGSFESVCDYFPQINLGPFPNGQIEGLVPNQWQVADSDLAYLSTRTSDANGYTYHIPDYSNLSGHSTGYTVFRPSNGQ